MFRFTQTIIRELSACASPELQCWYRLHISLLEVIGTVAAYFVQSCYVCGSCTVQSFNMHSAWSTRITGLNNLHVCTVRQWQLNHFNIQQMHKYICVHVHVRTHVHTHIYLCICWILKRFNCHWCTVQTWSLFNPVMHVDHALCILKLCTVHDPHPHT